MRRRGATMVELVVTLVIISLGGVATFRGLSVLGSSWNRLSDLNTVVANNRTVIDTLSEHLRNAQVCGDTTSTLGTYNAAIGSGSGTGVTYYVDTSSCSSVQYVLSGSNLHRISGSTDTVVAQNIISISLIYYKVTSYFGPWTTTTNPSVPTTSELPNIAGVQVSVTSKVNNVSYTSSGVIRLRNSPKKTRLDGL